MPSTRQLIALGLVTIGGGLIFMTMGGDNDARRSGSEIPGPTSGVPQAISVEGTKDRPFIEGPVVPLPEVASQPARSQPVEHNEAGARAAAVAYLEATEEAVTLSPQEAADLHRSMATDGYANELAMDTELRMTELVEAIPAGIKLRVAPIEARSVADGDDWLVSIWYVQAITIADESVVDDWRTVNYRLRWEVDTWKIALFDSIRGPMPGRGTQAPSASPSQFEALLAGYSDDGLN